MQFFYVLLEPLYKDGAGPLLKTWEKRMNIRAKSIASLKNNPPLVKLQIICFIIGDWLRKEINWPITRDNRIIPSLQIPRNLEWHGAWTKTMTGKVVDYTWSY